MKKLCMNCAAILFWIAVWYTASKLVNSQLLLASPVETCRAIFDLAVNGNLFTSVGITLRRLAIGYLSGTAAAVVCAWGAASYAWAETLLRPLIRLIRAIPVASFVVILLIWVHSAELSVIIAFLMAYPVLYESLLTGLKQRDRQKREMAKVFEVSPWRIFRHITLYDMAPYIRTGLVTSIGLCWKAGIAAEVIGQPAGSIGSALYRAKVYFATPELFAWTITAVTASVLTEKLILWLFDRFVGGTAA